VRQEKLEWFREQVAGFVHDRATYDKLAKTLGEILEQARDRYAPMGRVDARAKAIASFAEKALRKYDKYQKPLERMTDLAGARIVVYSRDEADAVCRFIESEDGKGFRIDWDNSQDARQSMKTGEFGYNGVHYIVELCRAKILGVDVPAEIQSVAGKRSYKAEIQVHTALQNVWSTIGHDRLYKTQVKVPESLKREVHSVAATLESLDRAFARSIESLDRYIRHFEAYRRPAELEDEIHEWKAIHDEVPTDDDATHQLGRHLMAAQRWTEAHETLEALGDVQRSDVQMEIGQAAWRARPSQAKRARRHLCRAVELAPTDWGVWCALAETYRRTDVDKAIECYGEASANDPGEPAILSPLVECHIRRDRSLEKLGLMQGALEASRCECHERAIRGVNVPQAHFSCARLHLYRGEWYEGMNSYCMALATCHLPEMICDELDALTAILEALAKGRKPGDKLLASSDLVGFEWARRLMIVALAAGALTWKARPKEPGAKAWKRAGENRKQQLRALATPTSARKGDFALPVAIVAGGCDRTVERKLITRYGKHLQGAFEAFSGTIISGGTTAGISGMVGRLKPSPGRTLHKVAYLPNVRRLPCGDKRSDAYEVRPSPGEGYNPAGVLRAWADILLQGIRPGQVRILGINGGDLTGFELRLGLALGGIVGVAEDSERVVKSLLDVRSPCRPEGLVPLPTDAATWAAFIRGASPELGRLTNEQVEPAAQRVHEQFRDDNVTNPEKHDKSVFPWPTLPEVYRDSCRHQARFAALILDAAGYDVVPAGPGETLDPENPPLPADYEKKVEAMAELEHGRFCAERLVSGWRRGPKKDLARKLNATIVPWTELPPGIRKYDFDAVRNFPKWLAAAGLKIVPRR